ncbi:hypothetical protein GCM10027057_27160 [Marisediminicola antarctica]
MSARVRLLSVIAAIAIATTAGISGNASEPAFAIDYPTWADVENARNNEAAKQAEVARIEAVLQQLATQVEETKAAEKARGEDYQEAQQAFDEAKYKADQLQLQADEAQLTAGESKLRAGQLAARLARSGGGDVSASLFFDGASAADLLSQLGMASKITDQSAGIYQKAIEDQNTAQSLTDQANVAKDALQDLADAAEAALQAATEAADAAAAALAEQQENEAVLRAQLSVLEENRAATEADYQAGVRAREAEAKRVEAARQAAVAAARAAAAAEAAAAAAASAGAGAAAAPAAAGGSPSPSGSWVRPSSGYVSSSYGFRVNPYSGVYAFHAGTDVGAGCGYPIYAASSGTVTYSGWSGGYGNYVSINHGGGLSTAYAHIANGGLLVSRGQSVGAGQLIALVGSTGGSTGCHLHYEVRRGGATVDPVQFMRAQGVSF